MTSDLRVNLLQFVNLKALTTDQLKELREQCSIELISRAYVPQECCGLAHVALDLDRYISRDVPEGFDTILGYLAKTNPEALYLMDDEAEATQRDGWKLKYWARKEMLPIYKVTAPPALTAQGIFEVNAYPVKLLHRRFDSGDD